VKIDEVRALGDDELRRQLESAHEELFDVRLRLATKQLTNHREILRLKKKIARTETILRERELGIRQA
jgi:large subunit ribosomal protein L29